MIELGKTAKDIVTGFEGIVTGRVEYLTGCNQYLVTPKIKDGASKSDALWFDENRLTVTKAAKIVIPSLESKQKGGPSTYGSAPIR